MPHNEDCGDKRCVRAIALCGVPGRSAGGSLWEAQSRCTRRVMALGGEASGATQVMGIEEETKAGGQTHGVSGASRVGDARSRRSDHARSRGHRWLCFGL